MYKHTHTDTHICMYLYERIQWIHPTEAFQYPPFFLFLAILYTLLALVFSPFSSPSPHRRLKTCQKLPPVRKHLRTWSYDAKRLLSESWCKHYPSVGADRKDISRSRYWEIQMFLFYLISCRHVSVDYRSKSNITFWSIVITLKIWRIISILPKWIAYELRYPTRS